MIIYNKKSVIVQCSCGCKSAISISINQDKSAVVFDFYMPLIHSFQQCLILQRLKHLIDVLIHKKTYPFEILLEKDEVIKLSSLLHNFKISPSFEPKNNPHSKIVFRASASDIKDKQLWIRLKSNYLKQQHMAFQIEYNKAEFEKLLFTLSKYSNLL